MKNKKKIIYIIIIVIVLILLYWLYSYLRVKFAKIEVTLKSDLKLEFNDKKRVSDYIENINGKIIDDYIIDSSELGLKEVTVYFKNDDNIKVKYKYQVEVIDTKEPLIWLGDTYNVSVGSDIDLAKKILCGDNYDSNVTCTIEGSYDLNTVGNYDLVFKAVDSSGNEENKEFVLNVYEPSEIDSESTNEVNYNLFSDIKAKYKNDNNMVGIDISFYQGNVDFKQLKDDGVEFVMIRVGYSKGTNGKYILDEKFKRNIKNAKKQGLKVGIYFYSYADSIDGAKKDAEWVIKQIKKYDIDLPVVFDWEDWNNFNEYHLSFFKLTSIANAFLDTLSNQEYTGMLYGSKNYLEHIWMDTDYDIWVAQYNSEVTYNGKYKMWQICDNGIVDGINGYVDIDILYK